MTAEAKIKEDISNNRGTVADNTDSPLPTPVDWTPPEKCYFCVDGKLLTVNDKGELVAETGPAQSAPVLANRVCTNSSYIDI